MPHKLSKFKLTTRPVGDSRRLSNVACAGRDANGDIYAVPDVRAVRLTLTRLIPTVLGDRGEQRVVKLPQAPTETHHASIDAAKAHALAQHGQYDVLIEWTERFTVSLAGKTRKLTYRRSIRGRTFAGVWSSLRGASMNARVGNNLKGYLPIPGASSHKPKTRLNMTIVAREIDARRVNAWRQHEVLAKAEKRAGKPVLDVPDARTNEIVTRLVNWLFGSGYTSEHTRALHTQDARMFTRAR